MWNVETITDRLTNLHNVCPEHHLCYDINPKDPDTFVENIRSYATNNAPEELMDIRETLFESLKETPEYLYLRATSEEAPAQFHHYAEFIQEDIGCDEDAAAAFCTLFDTSPPEAPHGYMEACRVLAHCLKDNHKGQHQNEHMSRFLQKSF